MINKVVGSAEEAVADIPDNASILVAGWVSGSAYNLLTALANRKPTPRGLTVCGQCMLYGQELARVGALKKFISGYPSDRGSWIDVLGIENPLARAQRLGEIEVVSEPYGNIFERVRLAGAGIPAFYTPVGVGTSFSAGKEVRRFNGVTYMLVECPKWDYALVKAHKADRYGNLTYKGTWRGLNSLFAMAANFTIAEVDEIVEVGEITPEDIITPGIWVQRVVKAPYDRNPATFIMRASSDVPREVWIKAKMIPSEQEQQDEGPQVQEKKARRGLTDELICARAAREIKEGMYVNLGTGIPNGVANYIPEGLEVFLHAENGILGYRGVKSPEETDWAVVNAGGQAVAAVPGTSFLNCCDAFAMIRGKALDLTIVGGYQVSETGDLANYKLEEADIGNPGGAMDLAYGARRLMVLMEHTMEDGRPKIVRQCSRPLTGVGVVSTIITNYAYMEVTPQGILLKELAPGIIIEEVQAATEVKLIVAPDVKEMDI